MAEGKPSSLSKGIVLLIIGVGLLVGVAVFWLTRDISKPTENSNASSSPVQTMPRANESPKTDAQGEVVTKTGEMVCLPPKDTSGVQDMSCALGMKSGADYYALAGSSDQLIGIATGQAISVNGTLTSPTQAQSRYNTQGTIHVQTITKQ